MGQSRTAAEQLAKYLSPRMRTAEEAKQHLRDKGFDEAEIRETVNEFIRLGYLNDADYVRAYCEYAYDKKRGRKRIARELEQKGISPDVIRDGIDDFVYENHVNEDAAAQQIADRVLDEAAQPAGRRQAAKIARKLEGLGYESGTILRVLDRIKE